MDEIEKAIAAIRAQGGDEAAVQRYLASIGAQPVSPGPSGREREARARARQAQNEEERKALNTASTSVMNFLDAGTFGLAGLAQDALAPGPFRANRDARRQIYDSIPTGERAALGLAGGLLNPVRVFRAAGPKTGVIGTALRGAREGATQGAAQGFGENVGTTDGAARATATGALAGGLLGGAIPAAVRAAQVAPTLPRIFSARPLGETAMELADAMKKTDNVNYGKVDAEIASTPSSPAIQEVLESQTVKPFADMVRRSEQFKDASDSRILTEAYKLMSAAQRRAAKSIEGTPEFLADIELRTGDIGLAKGRMLDAAGKPDPVLNIPGALETFPPAVMAHRASAEGIAAFNKTADAVGRILTGTSVKGKKLTLDSPEALERAIRKMNPEQAQNAMAALLGRGREVLRLSSNPVGFYGVRPSIANALRTPSTLDPYIRLLEEQIAGKPKQVRALMDKVTPGLPGLLGRVSGSQVP